MKNKITLNDIELKGVVRRIDKLGRVCLPKEYRKEMEIEINDPLELFITMNNEIIIRKKDS